MGAGQREKLFERGAPQTRFQSGQGADGDARLLREGREGDLTLQAQTFEPRPDQAQGAIDAFIHFAILPFGNNVCAFASSVITMKHARPGSVESWPAWPAWRGD